MPQPTTSDHLRAGLAKVKLTQLRWKPLIVSSRFREGVPFWRVGLNYFGSVALVDRRRCDLYRWTDSDAFREHFECDPEPFVQGFVGGELVVTAP